MARLDRAQLYEQLDNGSVDLAIGGHLAPPKRMLSERLYDESFVCIADQRHPAARRKLDLERYLALPHALFTPSDDGSARGVVDAGLARLGRKRRVACTFAHIVALPHAVRGTDLIATLARRAAAAGRRRAHAAAAAGRGGPRSLLHRHGVQPARARRRRAGLAATAGPRRRAALQD